MDTDFLCLQMHLEVPDRHEFMLQYANCIMSQLLKNSFIYNLLFLPKSYHNLCAIMIIFLYYFPFIFLFILLFSVSLYKRVFIHILSCFGHMSDNIIRCMIDMSYIFVEWINEQEVFFLCFTSLDMTVSAIFLFP